MNNQKTNEKIFEKLKEIIDLPDNIISLNLHLKPFFDPVIEITRYTNNNIPKPNYEIPKETIKYKIITKNKFQLEPYNE